MADPDNPASDPTVTVARQLLGPEAYDYFATGSGAEETVRANVTAWRGVHLRPRVLRNVAEVDTSTTLLGALLRTPIAVAPTGYQRLAHAQGEQATAEGAAQAGSLFTLSTRATARFESMASVAGPWWFQVYVLRDRELTARLATRAAESGAGALVLTADTPAVARKARPTGLPGGPYAPSLVPELEVRQDEGVHQDPAVTCADIAWLAELTGLPVVVKGVLRADDARACLDAGAGAIWVSNHGGRQLDGAISTAHALGEVADAVAERCEVYVDGGLGNGRDVLRALALGARAVFLGRPVLWGLATAGADGVCEVLDTYRDEVAEALRLAGYRSVADVDRNLVSAETHSH